MKKYFKGVLNGVFLFLLMGVTIYFLLKDQELPQIINACKNANPWYLAAGVVFVLVFVCSESLIICYMMSTLKYKAPLKQCVKYSFIGFFFSCVTPSATGGQPAQLYYMSRDGLDISVSSLVLMIITVAYKGVLLILSGMAWITQRQFIHNRLGHVRYILIYGIIVNGLFIAFLLLVIFKTSIIRGVCTVVVRRLACWRMIKHEDEKMKKIMISLDQYHRAAMYLKSHGIVLVNVFLITIFQRLSLFAVTWLVYRSFGLHGTNIWQIICIQTIIALAVDMLPLPGGIGASEASFLVMYEGIFGTAFVLPGMLLSRGISYYMLLLISGLVTFGVHLMSHSGGEKIINDRII